MRSFETKLMWRNSILRVLYWLFGFTALLLVLIKIRLSKFYYYAHWIYPNANLKKSEVILKVYEHYWSENIWPLIYMIPVAFILDIFLRKFYARV